jgi:hypothetical protein
VAAVRLPGGAADEPARAQPGAGRRGKMTG